MIDCVLVGTRLACDGVLQRRIVRDGIMVATLEVRHHQDQCADLRCRERGAGRIRAGCFLLLLLVFLGPAKFVLPPASAWGKFKAAP